MPVTARDIAALQSRSARDLVSGRRKRILFLLPNSGAFGGLERHLLQLLEKVVQNDVNITIVCLGADVLSEHLDRTQASSVQVLTEAEPASLFAWAKLFRRLRADTMVFCYGWILSFPWFAPLAGMIAGTPRRLAIQHLVLPAIPPPYPGKSLYGALRRSMGERARRLYGWRLAGYLCTTTICVSDAVRKSLVETVRFPARRTITVHNGVSTADFEPAKGCGESVCSRLGIGADDFVLVCAARLSKVKGVDIVIQALARAAQQGIPCKCMILGDGPLRDSLSAQAKALGVTDRVFFEGFQPDVRPYLQAASAFILTSHTEGLPLSVLEAMACELPCIVTDVGGTAEAVLHGETGLVISPGSVEEAASAIVHLATHPQECAEMARKARERVCRLFNLDQQMSEITRIVLGMQ